MRNIFKCKNSATSESGNTVNSYGKEDLLQGDRNKFLARHIILNEIKPFDGEGISYSSSRYVHVIIVGADDLSLHLARQAALICHYPNFDDESESRRTRITIINPQATGAEDIEILKDRFEQITGNLLSHCVWSGIYNETVQQKHTPEQSFIDVEFEFLCLSGKPLHDIFDKHFKFIFPAIVSVLGKKGLVDEETIGKIKKCCHQYHEVDEEKYTAIHDYSVDVRRAKIVNMFYNAGTHLNDIHISDIYEIVAYNISLKTFSDHTTNRKIKKSWTEVKKVEKRLSNLFCGDCLEIKQRSLEAGKKEENSKTISKISFERQAKSEHARWNVEKLILGYRPYTPAERYTDEILFAEYDKMKAERNRMKDQKKVHIDICSCRELMRIDFSSFKYDCFLTLAVDDILKKEKKNNRVPDRIRQLNCSIIQNQKTKEQ